MSDGLEEAPTTGTVLVIEDDDMERELLRYTLSKAGYTVVAVESGRTALTQLRLGFRPAVVVVDLGLPDLPGDAFCRAHRGDPQLRDVPVVLFSGNDNVDKVAEEIGVPWVSKARGADLLRVLEDLPHRGRLAAR